MSSKILIAASSIAKCRTLAAGLKHLGRKIDRITPTQRPRIWKDYRLLVCEVGGKLGDPMAIIRRMPAESHVVLLVPTLDVREVAMRLTDSRVNHIIQISPDNSHIRRIGEKLATGGIFGMERVLPDATSIYYRRILSYSDRCKALEELEAFTEKKRLRGKLRREACSIAEELLMNAMYQAPVNESGDRLFENLTARARLKRKTPRPVSLRYAVHNKVVYISVRDRFGSLTRTNFARYLQRCVATGAEPERKRLGAGVGLYLVTSLVSGMWVNLLPGGVTEFICTLGSTDGSTGLQNFSFTTQRPFPTLYDPARGYAQVSYISGD